jgi:hypothetical protein
MMDILGDDFWGVCVRGEGEGVMVEVDGSHGWPDRTWKGARARAGGRVDRDPLVLPLGEQRPIEAYREEGRITWVCNRSKGRRALGQEQQRSGGEPTELEGWGKTTEPRQEGHEPAYVTVTTPPFPSRTTTRSHSTRSAGLPCGRSVTLVGSSASVSTPIFSIHARPRTTGKCDSSESMTTCDDVWLPTLSRARKPR